MSLSPSLSLELSMQYLAYMSIRCTTTINDKKDCENTTFLGRMEGTFNENKLIYTYL